MTTQITRRQREVLDHLSKEAAFSRDTAAMVYGSDINPAEKLATNGVVNKRYDSTHGDVYWIRADGEVATGVSVPAGFVVILNRRITTPSGRMENFFLARAIYDGKGATFRALLCDWMRALDLKNKDLLSDPNGRQVVSADEPMFNGDHVILDALRTPTS